MKNSKFKIALSLLIVIGLFAAGTVITAAREGSPLWEMIWKVEQPVEVTGKVVTANMTTFTLNWDDFHLNEENGFGQEFIQVIKVDGLRRVNVWYDENGPPDDRVQMSIKWQIEINGAIQNNELPAADLENSDIFSSDVKGSHLMIKVWTESEDDIGPLDVIIYAW